MTFTWSLSINSTHGYDQTIITHGEQSHADQGLVKMIHIYFPILGVCDKLDFEVLRKHNFEVIVAISNVVQSVMID